MKKNIIKILSISAAFLSTACGVGNIGDDYTLYGEVADHSLDGSYLFIDRFNEAQEEGIPTDSVKIENGRFVFSGKTDKPRLMSVRCGNRLRGEFIAEPGKIYCTFDPSQDYLVAEISGTPINDDYQKIVVEPTNAYHRIAGPLEQWKRERIKAGTWTNEDAKIFDQKRPERGVSQKMESAKTVFVDKYIHEFDVVESMLVLYAYTESAWNKYATVNTNLKSIKNPFAKRNARWMSKLSDAERVRLEQAIEAFHRQIEKMTRKPEDGDPDEIIPEAVQVGGHFIDFERTTADGKPFSLKKAVESNKLVILDFWISPQDFWLSHINQMYKKYKDQGLFIVGVSVDKDETRWREKLENLNMRWPQIRSIGDNEEIDKMYGVRFMPHVVLIDQKGTIVARKLRGSDLENKIVETLK